MGETSQNIRELAVVDLQEVLQGWGEQKFRAKQVHEWLWSKHVSSFEEMTNLSEKLRSQLASHFFIPQAKIVQEQVSKDRTIKNAFRLHDGNVIEGVLIPTSKRMTACISTQVGCSLTCKFCATGKLERKRNVQFDEIYDQVYLINKQANEHYKKGLSNIVFMGMGEPLLNYSSTLKSIAYITSPNGMGMSPKRITVSTAGIAKMIKKLGDDEVKFNLALSLHAANDVKRDQIMPINEQNSLNALREAILYFYEKTGSRITYEYCIFKDFNDGLEDAKELADFCKISPCKVNIIEYNSIGDQQFQQTTEERLNSFVQFLEDCNLVVNVRRSRGKDIDAACGQLANKNNPQSPKS